MLLFYPIWRGTDKQEVRAVASVQYYVVEE